METGNSTREGCRNMSDRLSPQLKKILPVSGLLRNIRGFDTDVSGLPIRPISERQAVQGGGGHLDT
jgi:hypothetical protein